MKPMRLRKIQVFFWVHWKKFLIIGIVVTLILLAIWGLMSLESFYRHLTLAQMPIQFLMAGINASIFVYMYLTFMRGGFSKMDKKKTKGAKVNIKWDDVIAMDEAKQEAMELVDLIQDRTRIQKIGGKIIRGILMVGPPGCGKTYLAKAIATEAGIPFISMGASEFNEVFVGVGASRVRKLFKKARELSWANGACIIFIDELDAIGRTRQYSFLGGGGETNATQNQLLIEMDGLTDQDTNVIIIGATNASEDTLDTALLRPGRFDRKIYVDRPDLIGREKIFRYYLSKVQHDPSIDIGRLARKALYKTPADIENIIKEAALIATRRDAIIVDYKSISEAIERIDMGIKQPRKMTEDERRRVAYHESGHLITTYLLHPNDDVFKASIVGRRGALGVVYPQPREEYFTHSKERILADIKVCLAGFVAEKVCFNTTSTGVGGGKNSDFHKATSLAHAMVWGYGMGSNGFIGDYGAIPPQQLSEEVKQQLNAETQRIVQSCEQDVTDLLTTERAILDRFAKELLDREELEFDEIDAIFKEYNKEAFQLPPEAVPPQA